MRKKKAPVETKERKQSDDHNRPVVGSVIAFVSESDWPTFRLGVVQSCDYSDDMEHDDSVDVQYLGFPESTCGADSEFSASYRPCWIKSSNRLEIQSDNRPRDRCSKFVERGISLYHHMIAADIEFSPNSSSKYGKLQVQDIHVIRNELRRVLWVNKKMHQIY